MAKKSVNSCSAQAQWVDAVGELLHAARPDQSESHRPILVRLPTNPGGESVVLSQPCISVQGIG